MVPFSLLSTACITHTFGSRLTRAIHSKDQVSPGKSVRSSRRSVGTARSGFTSVRSARSGGMSPVLNLLVETRTLVQALPEEQGVDAWPWVEPAPDDATYAVLVGFCFLLGFVAELLLALKSTPCAAERQQPAPCSR